MSDDQAFRRPEDQVRPEVRITGAPVELTPQAPPPPPAPRAPMSTRTKRLLGAGLAAVALLVAVPLVLGSGDDEPDAAPAPMPTATTAVSEAVDTAAADAFRGQVRSAFGSIGGVANVYLNRALTDWKLGATADATAEARVAMASTLPNVVRLREQLAAIPPFAPAPQSTADFSAAVTAYAQSLRLGLAAADLPDTPLQKQLRLQTLRLQALGDRLFDQGGRDLDGYLAKNPEVDAVVFQPAPEVPDFTVRGLLAGAPLVPAPRATVLGERPSGQNQQADEAWVAAVEAAGVPSAQEVAAAIDAVDGPALGGLANRLSAAALRIRDVDDPASGRADSTRVQLSLFVAAEGARAAEAAAQVSGAPRERLLVVARTLVALSDDRWDPRLSPRRSGYPASLLAD